MSVDIEGNLDALIAAAQRREPQDELRRMIHYLVPEYHHPCLHVDIETRRPRAPSTNLRRLPKTLTASTPARFDDTLRGSA